MLNGIFFDTSAYPNTHMTITRAAAVMLSKALLISSHHPALCPVDEQDESRSCPAENQPHLFLNNAAKKPS